MHHIPYAFNLLVLGPALLLIMQGKMDVLPEKDDMAFQRLLIASLWLGVLLVSAVALFSPKDFWPVLVFQVVYNLVYAVGWVRPSLMGRAQTTVPRGAVVILALMIVTWPIFIYAALVASA